MVNKPTARAAVLACTCVDTALRIAPEIGEILGFVWKHSDHPLVDQLRQEYLPEDRLGVIAPFRSAGSGGGYSETNHRDIKTVALSGLQVVAFISKRHSDCKSLRQKTQLTDPECAVMAVTDFAACNVNLPPFYRAHVRINRDDPEKMEIAFEHEPMDLVGLVAHAVVHGTTSMMPPAYRPHIAARLLGIHDQCLEEYAEKITLSEKGLLIPQCELP